MPCGGCGKAFINIFSINGKHSEPVNTIKIKSDIEIHNVIIEEIHLKYIMNLKNSVNENDFELIGKYFISNSVEFLSFIGKLHTKKPTSYIGILFFNRIKDSSKIKKDFSVFNNVKK